MKDTNIRESKFHLTADILKFIAIIAMTIDHAAYSFVPYDPPSVLRTLMHIIGMIAAPTMFYFAVEGYHHTRNIKKYLSRLAVFAVISQFPFSYFVNGGVVAGLNIQSYIFINVIYTILLGVSAIHVRRNLKNPIAKTILILLLVILSTPANWGSSGGVIIMLTFDYFYGSFKKQAFGYCTIVSLIVILAMNIHIFLARFFIDGTFDSSNLYISGIQQMGMFIPIILLCFYNGQKGKGGAFTKWFFYIFYPLHLLILGFLHATL